MLLPRRAPALPPRHARRAPFSTLTPSRLVVSDWLDASGKSDCYVRYKRADVPFGRVNFRLGGVAHAPDVAPRFPPGAAGFLYAHAVPGHPAAGAVRLRRVPAPDPALFAAGADLRLPSGLPWALPFPALAGADKYATLRAALVREGFVRAADWARWAAARAAGGTQVVHARGAAFAADLGASSHIVLHVAHGADVRRVHLRGFASMQVDKRHVAFWSGAAQLALEYQPNEGAFALRVLRILTPILPNPAMPARAPGRRGPAPYMLPPTEGSLLMRWQGAADDPRPHLFDVRKRPHHPLRFLMPEDERVALERELGLDSTAPADT